MISRYIISVFLVTLQCVKANKLTLEDIQSAIADVPEDTRLSFPELCKKYGFKCDTHDVITEDGYNLTLFNMPGNRSQPLLMTHGFLDSADTWIIRNKLSWAAFLFAKGYDVWFGNVRGNKYSRKHVKLNPDRDLKFWDYTFHEMAIYDMPAMIDFILEARGQAKLQLIGHSQGTSLTYVLGSVKPEYNDKISISVSLAPIAFLDHAQGQMSSLLSLAGGPVASGAIGFLGQGEFMGNSSALVSLLPIACTQKLVGNAACGLGLASALFGSDPEQFEPEFVPIAFGHYPCGTSLRNAVHLLQIIQRKTFGQYDLSPVLNYQKYNSTEPPAYDLSKNTMKHAFIVGLNDPLSTVPDVTKLKGLLPNVVEYKEMELKQWNHIDFVWGKYMNKYLFDYVHGILQKYNHHHHHSHHPHHHHFNQKTSTTGHIPPPSNTTTTGPALLAFSR